MGYGFETLAPGHDLGAFDCGVPAYNAWLVRSAEAAQRSGTAQVRLLVSLDEPEPRSALGYLAICPTAVLRDTMPRSVAGGAPDPIPGYLIAKLALDRSMRGDATQMWGTQLVVEALRRIVRAADAGGGRVVVVDADNEGLVPWYRSHSFRPTAADPLRSYMKVATARRLIEEYDGR